MIGIVMASTMEAQPFIDGLALKQEASSPIPIYAGKELVLIISGIGKANAAAATAYLCTKYQPSLICNAGAAGAADFDCSLGEIYQISQIYELDRSQLRSGKPHFFKPDLLPGFQSTSLATQDNPVIDPSAREKVSAFAKLIDMEAAAICQTCRKLRVQCCVFKFVSDCPQQISCQDVAQKIKEYRQQFFDYFRNSVLPALAPY